MTAIGRRVRRSGLLMVGAAALIAGVAATRGNLSAAPVEARFHLKLLHASPGASETLSVVPKTVHLWFSEAPEVAVSSVSMISSTEAAIPMGTARVGEADQKGNPCVTATIEKPLTAGTYSVRWRVTAKDGHIVRGSYKFVVTAAATETR